MKILESCSSFKVIKQLSGCKRLTPELMQILLN
jgi:hypothetical protein